MSRGVVAVSVALALAPACRDATPSGSDAPVECETRRTFERDLKKWSGVTDFRHPMGATLVRGVGIAPACLGEPTWVARSCVETEGSPDVRCARNTGWELEYKDGALERVRACFGDRVLVGTSRGSTFGEDGVRARNDEGAPEHVIQAKHGRVIWQYPGMELEFSRSFDEPLLRVECFVVMRPPAAR